MIIGHEGNFGKLEGLVTSPSYRLCCLQVHRRLLFDDRRGVGEPLNETGTSGHGLVITGVRNNCE